MKSLLLAILMTLSLHHGVSAMQVETQGNMVFATGPVENDLNAFQEALAKPGVDTVVFVNSPGGDLWTGLVVGRLIADKGLKTVTAGYCVSACSIMFMGGKERSFADSFRPAQTFIGIHGAHLKDTKSVDARLQPQIFAFYKSNMGSRFNADIMNTALYDMEDAGALLRVYDAQRKPARVPFHCRSSQSRRADCQDFKEQDAVSLGIVTSGTLTQLTLPPAFIRAPLVLGQPLTQALQPDPESFYRKLGEATCAKNAAACLRSFDNLATAQEHKAIAFPVSASGYAVVSNRDTAIQAFVAAVYQCNHPKDRPARLCETHYVNGYDVRPITVAATSNHAEALRTLSVPTDGFFANEEFGGGLIGSAAALRVQKLKDITPQRLEGVTTIGTRDLVIALKGAQPPVLIDAWAGSNDVIPGSGTLASGGVAFPDPAADQAFENRFAGLLALLSPHKAQPIVFYGQGRENWQAVNAALRARKLGYTQVNWYRGGLDSWRAANLPTAGIVLRAVANY